MIDSHKYLKVITIGYSVRTSVSTEYSSWWILHRHQISKKTEFDQSCYNYIHKMIPSLHLYTISVLCYHPESNFQAIFIAILLSIAIDYI